MIILKSTPAQKRARDRYYLKNRKKILERKRQYFLENRAKRIESFRQYYLDNKEKELKRRHQYHLENKEKILKRSHKYYLDNKEKILKYARQWRIDNRDRQSKYQKNKRDTNLNYRIGINLRTRLRMALKRNLKSGSAVKDLGCTVPELVIYLQSMFKDGMTWENYGYRGWHIDHIKPLVSFDLTDRKELLKACHYTNLQPLWAFDNWSKGYKQSA